MLILHHRLRGMFAAALRADILDTFHDSLGHFTIKEVSRKL